MTDPILTQRHDGWAEITLNRPDRLNAFNQAMSEQLAATLAALASDSSCRAVLLTGAGRGFCAGQDLGDGLGGAAPDLGAIIERLYNPLVRRLRSLPKPVVCAVNGVAAGAGANLAFACDIVLAARSAKFIQAFAKIGLVPDCGGTFFLPRLVGEARARALMMTAEPLAADKAAEWGMIWKAFEDAELMTEARKLTAHLATQPTAGLALIKQALEASTHNGLEAQLDVERDLQSRAGCTPDHAEGVKAFVEKRAPHFTGRPE